MAKRPTQNTEAPQDSLQGGAPAEVEGAAPTGGPDSAPVSAGEGANTSPVATDADADRAALAAALTAIGEDQTKILPDPDPIDVEVLERRLATTASAIELDGHRFGLDDPIPLTEPQFEQLKATGALVEATWDELTPI